MKTTARSTCSYCGVGCGVKVELDSQGHLQLTGDEQNPANYGKLCSKGMNLHHVAMDTTDRILQPKWRKNRDQDFQDTSWIESISYAADKFKSIIAEHGPDSVGLYLSGQMLIEEYYIANKLTKGFLGTNNVDTNSRLCMSSAVVAYKKSIGEDAPPISYADIESCDCFFISGANPAWCHPILFRRIEARKAANPNVKIIVVDPRKTQSAQDADLFLQINPGTDIYLTNAIAKLLIEQGYSDEEFLAAHVNNVDDLKSFLAKVDTQEAADICGIPHEQIQQAVTMIGEAKTLLTMWAMGLNQSIIGVNKNLSLINLNLITGRIGKEGSGPFSLTGQPDAMGGREVGGLANMLAAHRELSNPEHIKEVADFWGVKTLSDKPGFTATEMVEAMESGKLKAIWIICTNPLVSLPNLERVEKAFSKAEFVMVSEISNRSDTIKFADVVLPAAAWLEKEGTMTNSDRRMTYLPKVIQAPGSAKPDVEIIAQFAQAMGYGHAFSYSKSEEIFNEHRALTKGTNIDITGVTYDRLKQASIQWPCPEENHPGTPRLFSNHQFWTPNGKANVYAVEPENQSDPTTEEFPLVLTTGRIRDQWHTMTKTGKVNKLNQHISEPYLEIHPNDAAALDIAEGELVQIINPDSQSKIKATITDSIKQGTVFAPMHWGRIFNSIEARANNLTTFKVDPTSKEPDFKFSAVKVSKITQEPKKIIIVGAGASCLEFIHSYRAMNAQDEIHVFAKEPHLFYNRILLPDYINEDKSWDSLLSSNDEELASLNIHFHQGTAIDTIDKDTRHITDSNGTTHSYDKLILATGSRPAQPMPVPENMQGIFGLRTKQDADAIMAYLKAGETATIVGGGLLGLELAGALNSIGIKVTILQRSNSLMRGQLDALGAEILHEEVENRGIKVLFDEEVERIEDKQGDGKVDNLVLKSGKQLPTKGLFFAAGIKPNIEIAINAGIDYGRGVQVNDQLQTSDPYIYAMGEIAEHRELTYGTTPAAQDQARILARSLNGDIYAHYEGSLSFNVLKIPQLELCSIGIIDKPEGKEYQEITMLDRHSNYYKKCILKHDRLIGAILIGDKSEFSEFKTLIEQGLELADKRQTLLRGGGKPAEQAIGPIICSCNNVGEGNITNAIAKGCDQFEELCSLTNAGTGCGSCRPEVQKILSGLVQTANEAEF